MNVSYALLVLCQTCGHPRAFHRYVDGNGCMHEVKDHDDTLMRCGCDNFIPQAEEITPPGDKL